jgi:hypothetical protein
MTTVQKLYNFKVMNMNEKTSVRPKCEECGDEDYVIEVEFDSGEVMYWCMKCLQRAAGEDE